MFKRTLWALACFALSIPAYSYSQIYQKTSNGIRAEVNGTNLEILFYSPEIVRVVKYPIKDHFEKNSLSVIARPETVQAEIKKNGDFLKIRTSKLIITLNLRSGELNYTAKDGRSLLKEKQNGASFLPFNDAGSKTQSVSQSFVLDSDEAIYGLGQHQRGILNQRHVHYHDMVQGNTEDVVPLFQSVKGYGIYWDNYSPTSFDDSAEETSFKSDVGDGVDYYFIYGGNADSVIAGMRHLTGQAPMFPLWTFGYWQSRERYKSQDEIVGVVKKYRELKVPLDGVIQDWQYWGDNYLWNSMEFLNPAFPDPQSMVDDIHHMNAHMIISIWASFGPETKQFREMKPKGMLLDFHTWPESGIETWPPRMDYPSGVRPYDAYNPEARDIYWNYINKGLFSKGIDGWWMDSTEPDHLDFKPSDFDLHTYLGSFRKVRNAFPLMTVGGVSQHQRDQSQQKRVFILTRSAFAGQQRYGSNTWSGDITSSWETLQKQVPTGLDFSLSGIPYWNCDIGGFFLGKYTRKLDDPDYRELYSRWIEFGAFTPMMRSHGTDAPREIYQFGKKGDRIYDLVEKYIKLRYKMLPYIYAASWDVTAHQSSMMRALMMDFAGDKKTWDISDEYMFGRSILVSPVLTPMYTKSAISKAGDTVKVEDFSEVKIKKTYLPKGFDWFDFWSGEKFKGGQEVTRQAPLDIIPLYVRAGAIIPVGPDVQYATEKKWDDLEIHIYPGANGDFTLYEDENDNYNYEKGKYSFIHFHWDDRSKELKVGNREGAFEGMPGDRKFKLIIAGGEDSKTASVNIKTIRYDGSKVSISF